MTRTKALQDSSMNVLNAEIWKRQEKEMSGITVFTSKITGMVRMMEEHSNLQLTKNASKIQLCREETTLDVPIRISVRALRL